jgi:hypothetical protein
MIYHFMSWAEVLGFQLGREGLFSFLCPKCQLGARLGITR